MTWLPGPFGLILDRPVIGMCELCGVPFHSRHDIDAHLATPEHADNVTRAREAHEAKKKALALFHESDDPEIEAHMKQVGETMRKEGRWTVKRNERAGFD